MSQLRRYGTFDRLRIPVDDSGLRLAGKPISDYGISLILGGVEIDVGDPVSDFATVPGMSGSVNRSLRDASGHTFTDRRTITMHVATTGSEMDAWETKVTLGSLDGMDMTLEWGVMPGWYEGYLTVGAWTDEYGHGGIYRYSTCDLTLLAQPDLIGRVPLGFEFGVTPVSAHVKGNRPSRPTIRAVPPADTKRLYLTIGGTALIYDLTNADGARELVADCENRSSTFGGTVIFPTVDSDYSALVPGVITASTSAGTASLTYRPRYRI
ncbi:hypothetical protein BW13_00970 [Bifidobacterium sp. UTCIF-37]|uniref:phage distal tail protein n=1 Tax=unclassified Bifidobacterium TaxID=2608897 RepID=UPI00112C7BCC|nr:MULTISPECIES: hypothetical protein [unclassified Bifidobacterium]TPF87451.1 hypothetical protein BW13_00970 [Bifidobacterium sp. UTCIF-37]TPF91227.1 hypothetical protein BW11_00970 [Bifidobacterium sp. UTCIF-38]